MNRSLAAQHGGEHGYALFGEYIGRVSATSSPPGFLYSNLECQSRRFLRR
jgi:hypothetical protein